MDGVRGDQLTAIDVTPSYWELGLNLFRDGSEMPVKAYFGNVLKAREEGSCFYAPQSPSDPPAFKYVWTGLVLHVLNQQDCEAFVRQIYDTLLLRAEGEEGATYFGTCVGSRVAREWIPTPNSQKRYLHSRESLRHLFETVGFVNIEVRAYERVDADDGDDRLNFNSWKRMEDSAERATEVTSNPKGNPIDAQITVMLSFKAEKKRRN